jgi:pyruvate/2-oxoglutarate dehydrogenase complex dihydrolipoamide dehydrogenase (E3) component
VYPISCDLAVVGGGTAGLVCAAGAAGLGARVVLVERARLGGDCLNTGCVPSKALLRAAADGVDFAAAMRRVRDTQAALAPHDSAERMTSLGVEVLMGAAAFTGPRELAVGDRTVRFKRAVIATGSRPAVPAIPELRDRPYLTTDTVWDLSTQPRNLLIVGGGPAGCELAQAFARFGTQVTLVERAPHLLPRDEADAGDVVARRLTRDGVRVLTSASVDRLPESDTVLVAVGRTSTVDGLGLDDAGVTAARDGIQTDDYLRTSNPRIFAAGDVRGGLRFTHAADAMARIVVQNALFFGRKKVSDLIIPWCTFTSPEVAHVGASDGDAITVPLSEVDRAVIGGDTDGFIRVRHRRGRITGATVVAPRAGELIALAATAMQQGATLTDLSNAVFPYPTEALALRRAGDLYRRTRLTPFVQRALRYYFRR